MVELSAVESSLLPTSMMQTDWGKAGSANIDSGWRQSCEKNKVFSCVRKKNKVLFQEVSNSDLIQYYEGKKNFITTIH